MSKSIGVELHAYDIIKPLGIVQLATLPYRSPAYVAQLYANLDPENPPSGNNVARAVDKTSAATVPAPDTPPANKTNAAVPSAQQSSPRAPTIVLAISMPYENSIRRWRWYEAVIETLAVGICLYATFVLTST
ncbi:hypothetical protein TI39_contig4211g00017 [Zymoseptoria brevis]|uniref:Uncharacterized protein n=1 Tax=Zymoseptoria brevis TaxID=1047168 RepID=A0A0F4G9X9_9PEZI|nr:hypothetical protein TI39_contig4211g00017 [Zymoseptoria brevis]